MGNDSYDQIDNSNSDVTVVMLEENSDFVGSVERQGQLCDYYVITTELGTLYYYIPRTEIEDQE